MRLIFLGSPPFGTPVLRHLLDGRHDVAAVVTPPDRPRGRGRAVVQSAVAALAEEAGVPLVQSPTPRDGEPFLDALRAFEPDVLVAASYGVILREDVLELAPQGALNVHASLLPRWRGASPIQRAIWSGDGETGVSVQRMVLALDEGDVLVERRTTIGARETGGELLARLAELGGEAIEAALDDLDAGRATFTPQDPAHATYARKLSKDDGLLDWTRPAAELERQVRALSPWPGTRTSLPDGRVLGVLAAEVMEGAGDPGTLITDGQLDVATGEGALRLLEVKPAGKAAMKSSDFLRGARLTAGQRLGEVAP